MVPVVIILILMNLLGVDLGTAENDRGLGVPNEVHHLSAGEVDQHQEAVTPDEHDGDLGTNAVDHLAYRRDTSVTPEEEAAKTLTKMAAGPSSRFHLVRDKQGHRMAFLMVAHGSCYVVLISGAGGKSIDIHAHSYTIVQYAGWLFE